MRAMAAAVAVVGATLAEGRPGAGAGARSLTRPEADSAWRGLIERAASSASTSTTTTADADDDAVVVERASTSTPTTATSTTTTAECQPAKHLRDTFTREQFPSSLGSCALVGSGGALKGRGIGGQINVHDTVIRVNRVPSEAYFSDLGSRTDVFYSNSATDTYPSGELGVWITKIREGLSVGEKLYCPFRPVPPSGSCPFAHLVVARSTKYGSDRIGDRIDMPFRIPDYLQPPFDVSHPSLALETFYWNSAPMQGYYTSGGLKAFFTVAPACDSITLYGFAGSGNIDNHTIDTVHSFETEHEWLHRIAVGDARDSDFRAVGAKEWLFNNGLNDSVMEELPSVIQGLQDRLRCMGERGKIRIDGWTSPASKELQELVDRGVQELAERRADAGGVVRSASLPMPDTAWSAAGVALALLVAAVLGRRRRQAEAAASHCDSEDTTSGSLI